MRGSWCLRLQDTCVRVARFGCCCPSDENPSYPIPTHPRAPCPHLPSPQRVLRSSPRTSPPPRACCCCSSSSSSSSPQQRGVLPYPLLACGGGSSSRSSPFSGSSRSASDSGGEAVAHGRRHSDDTAAASGRGRTSWAVTLARAAPDDRRSGWSRALGSTAARSADSAPVDSFSTCKSSSSSQRISLLCGGRP